MDKDLAKHIQARLGELGLTLDRDPSSLPAGAPSSVIMNYKDSKQSMLVSDATHQIGRDALEQVAPYLGQPVMLVAEHIRESEAQLYRAIGINYLDTRGNAFIRFGPVLIDVRGRRAARLRGFDTGSAPSEPSIKNLFSPKRAQVIFVLLSQPECENATVRELAHRAMVSVGVAQETLTLLGDHNYIFPTPTRQIRRRTALIDGWLAAYPSGLGAPRRARSFHGDPNTFEASRSPLYVSGESAVLAHTELRLPETLTLYTSARPTELALLNRWRTDREPNIFVRPQFWRESNEADKDWSPTRHPVRAAPRLLVYADLIASAESRQVEAADSMRKHDPEFLSA